MNTSVYKILLITLAIGISFISFGTEETYSVRKSSSEIETGLSFEVIDGRFAELGWGTFHDKSTRFLVKFGIEEREDYGYFSSIATMDAQITVQALSPIGEVLTTKTEHVIINYNPAGGNIVNLGAILDGDYHRYRVTIDDLTLADVVSIPDYVFIEAELQIDRYYKLDEENIPSLATNFTAYNDLNEEYKQMGVIKGTATEPFTWDPLKVQELELFWSYVEGAEEYELEWTWVDNYNEANFDEPLSAGVIPFSVRDFELNNTRIITSAQSYRIPLIYAKGYLIYRVRAVGRWTDNDLLDTDKLYFGKWSSDADNPLLVSTWPNYIEISSDHEAIKNWQYQAVYAEEGKKKEIISYFDGSLRNRQTVTRINSNNEAIVGENVYDNQGRSSIQILPTPVENAALRYYMNLNRNADGDVYTHYDFDWDTGECISGVATMSSESGASRYYSENPAASGNWQDYVPDADSIPFVQVEYTPDNTGRVRRQSGVGSAYTIDGEHATEYYYLQPGQEELNRLFGYHVGNAKRYKKNLVVDANGQVSISFIDPQGRVIATALTGNNLGDSPGETITNLLSLDEHNDGEHELTTRELLNKLADIGPDTDIDNNDLYVTGKQGAIADGLLLNTQYSSVDEQVHEFEYSVQTGTFNDPCMAINVHYPFAYDLNIDLRDDCGEDRFAYDNDAVPETSDSTNVDLLVGGVATAGYVGAVGTTLSIPEGTLSALLQTGGYSLSKMIAVNPDSLEKHLAHYMANLQPDCLPEFFENNADCVGDELPDDLFDDPVFNTFELTSCLISTKTMLTDLMPGGQYGATDEEDLTSVFTEENVLRQGADYDDATPSNWRNPILDVGIGYRNEDGSTAFVEVVEVGVDEWEPAVVLGAGTTEIDGIDYAKPEDLANLSDFLDAWESTWANALLEYHPEYGYFEHYSDLCDELPDASPAITVGGSYISSEAYNNGLLMINSYDRAEDPVENILGTDFISSAILGTHNIKIIDPYFNHEYTTIGEATHTDFDVTASNAYKLELIDMIVSDYKNLGMDIWEFAVKTVICGTDFDGGCIADASAVGLALYSEEQKNQIWSIYKQTYLAEKHKIDQIFVDAFAIRESFYNGYIGSDEPMGPNYMGYTYYNAAYSVLDYNGGDTELSISEIHLDAIEEAGDGGFPWLEKPNVSEFAEKQQRFIPIHSGYDPGLPEDVMLTELLGEVDADVYAKTGRCALSFDVEFLLNGMANNGLLVGGSSVNSEVFPALTPDLYGALGGEIGDTYTDEVLVSSTDLGSNIKIEVTNANGGVVTLRSIILNDPDPSDIDWVWNWADVSACERVYYIPGSLDAGVYDFQVLAKVDVLGEINEVILNGETQAKIGECYPLPGDLNEIICDREEQFANDLKNIFAQLYFAEPTSRFVSDLAATNALIELGGWYAGSQAAVQIADNPFAPIGQISTSALGGSFSLSNPIEEDDKLIYVQFLSGVPSDIAAVTGATVNLDAVSDRLTIHYIDDAGDAQSTSATVVINCSIGCINADLSCMCDKEKALALSFESFYSRVLERDDFVGTSADEDYDAFANLGEVLYSDWDEQITTGIEFEKESDAITVSFSRQNPEDLAVNTCAFEIVRPSGGTFVNISTMENIFHIRVNEGAPFSATGYAYIPDGLGAIIPIEIHPVTGFEVGCFEEIDCGCDSPTAIAPVSCTQALEVYDDLIVPLNLVLDPSEQFRIYTAEEFCAANLGYAAAAYENYLTLFGITTTEDDYYVSISLFASTNLNGLFGYPDVSGDYPAVLAYHDNYLTFPDLNWNTYINTVYIEENGLCPPEALPFYPDFDFDYPCEMYTANVDTVNAKNQEEIYLEKLAQNFRARYLEEALSSLIETFEVTYFDKEYHYTLYYYDQAGNLIQTVPPKGTTRLEEDVIDNDLINKKRLKPDDITLADVAALVPTTPVHSYRTQYHYNSLNQLVWQKTPDGGESYFGYDALGRLVVSQNALQAAKPNEQFSYTRYDELGRITEVGEMTLSTNYGFNENGRFIDALAELVDVSISTFPFNLGVNLEGLEEVTRTKYDELFGIDASDFIDYSADNTRNRITGVYYFETLYNGTFVLAPTEFDNATFYDYDVHGNVKEMIQNINNEELEDLDQDLKKVEYEYDLVSGNVKHVTFQKDAVDQFIHEYEYDSDNRITNVRTSRDEVIWEQDAKYFYYDHGPLARTEIGDKKIQSSDYAYTIQGWLKGVNSEDLDQTHDQGKDSKLAGINRMNGKDVYGYSLQYFENDYSARHGNDFLAYSDGAPLPITHNLYNGNIREMYTASTNTAETNIGTSHTVYKYDQLNRIRHMEQELLTGAATPSHIILTGNYESDYTYDQNGNLMSLDRWADDGTGVKTAIDEFDYKYTEGTNQLTHVDDALGSVFGDDLADQAIDNYEYDEIGQLIADTQEEIASIEWKVTGKVHKIIREVGSDKSDLEFVYDAMGNRIIKIVTNNDGDLLTKTYYIRDAQGNVMSIYNLENLQVIKDAAPIYGLNLTERSIYGSSRVGTENPDLLIARSDMGLVHEFDYVQTVGDRRYELSNHLGNVLEVITDRKLANTHLVGTSSEITVTDAVGISVDGSGIITKTGTTAWNAGGASVETITGDGSVKWTISSSLPENKYIMVGLSTNNIDENYTTIQYAWYARDLECRIYESGANIGTYGGFSEGTNFEIRRTGTTLEYLKDGVVQRTVLGVSTLPFLVDFSMYESGTKIEHLEIITGVTEEVYYVADVVSQSDYYPFGMLMPNTSDEPEEDGYRYGYQGSEKDDEVKGGNNSYTTYYRQLDPRIGRWLSIDPECQMFPSMSPYISMDNNPISYSDILGDSTITVGEGNANIIASDLNTLYKEKYGVDNAFSVVKIAYDKTVFKGVPGLEYESTEETEAYAIVPNVDTDKLSMSFWENTSEYTSAAYDIFTSSDYIRIDFLSSLEDEKGYSYSPSTPNKVSLWAGLGRVDPNGPDKDWSIAGTLLHELLWHKSPFGLKQKKDGRTPHSMQTHYGLPHSDSKTLGYHTQHGAGSNIDVNLKKQSARIMSKKSAKRVNGIDMKIKELQN